MPLRAVGGARPVHEPSTCRCPVVAGRHPIVVDAGSPAAARHLTGVAGADRRRRGRLRRARRSGGCARAPPAPQPWSRTPGDGAACAGTPGNAFGPAGLPDAAVPGCRVPPDCAGAQAPPRPARIGRRSTSTTWPASGFMARYRLGATLDGSNDPAVGSTDRALRHARRPTCAPGSAWPRRWSRLGRPAAAPPAFGLVRPFAVPGTRSRTTSARSRSGSRNVDVFGARPAAGTRRPMRRRRRPIAAGDRSCRTPGSAGRCRTAVSKPWEDAYGWQGARRTARATLLHVTLATPPFVDSAGHTGSR